MLPVLLKRKSHAQGRAHPWGSTTSQVPCAGGMHPRAMAGWAQETHRQHGLSWEEAMVRNQGVASFPHHSPARAAPIPWYRKLLHKQPPSCARCNKHPFTVGHSPGTLQPGDPTAPSHGVQPAPLVPVTAQLFARQEAVALCAPCLAGSQGEKSPKRCPKSPLKLVAPEAFREQALPHCPGCQDLSPQHRAVVGAGC